MLTSVLRKFGLELEHHRLPFIYQRLQEDLLSVDVCALFHPSVLSFLTLLWIWAEEAMPGGL